jgi:hypothetical protein
MRIGHIGHIELEVKEELTRGTFEIIQIYALAVLNNFSYSTKRKLRKNAA